MKINKLQTLKQYNTFKLNVNAKKIKFAFSITDLITFWKNAKSNNLPVLLLGMGSNVLFINNFNGLIILIRIKKLKITESKNNWFIHVGAGNNWHQLVTKLIKQKIYGLENMALIPGTVGAAPIQNISAYGLEFKDICNYVDLIDLKTNKKIRLNNHECQFSYRNSIFKNKIYKNCAIISVGLKIFKLWKPILTHSDLCDLNKNTITAEKIFFFICKIRKKKIPNPKLIGNAGSFFKNKIISKKFANYIKKKYPTCPLYIESKNTRKISSAWLIDQCNLKGYQYGGAAVDKKQALIIINKHNANGKDIINLVKHIHKQVLEKFDISLEPEVNIIGKYGKIQKITQIYL